MGLRATGAVLAGIGDLAACQRSLTIVAMMRRMDFSTHV